VGRSADSLLILLLLFQCLLGFRLFHTIWLHLRNRRAGMARERELLALPLPPDAELPAVLIQIPTFNEGALVRRALAAAIGLDWPRDRLHVQVLDDSTNESVELAREAVVEFRGDGLDVLLLQRPTRAGFKAGALKAGLERSYQPYIALFDVDYIPPADFLRRCMPPLIADPDLAFVQARCDFLNAVENRVTRGQQVILESHFTVEQPARSWSGRIVPFNGTCGIWRRSAIEAAGGWQTNTLTEDLDLSYRAQLAGWRSLYLYTVAVPGELPDTLRIWRNQQFRWNKGYAQTARKLIPRIWRMKLPLGRKIEAFLHLGGPSFAVLKIAETPLWVTDIGLGTCSWLVALPIMAFGLLQGIAGTLAIAYMSKSILRPLRDDPVDRGFWGLLGITLFTIGMHSYAGSTTARGVLQALIGHDSAFMRTPKRGAFIDPDSEASRG